MLRSSLPQNVQTMNALGRNAQYQASFLCAMPHLHRHHALARPHGHRCQHLRAGARDIAPRLLTLLPALEQPGQAGQRADHDEQHQQRGGKAGVIHG